MWPHLVYFMVYGPQRGFLWLDTYSKIYLPYNVLNTLNSKRKYTKVHFEFRRVSTQNLGHVGPTTGYKGQLVGVPHQTKLSLQKKIQSGSKVLKQSLKACALSASNTDVYGKN